MLEWLLENEKFCQAHSTGSEEGATLWRELLVGANDKSCRGDIPVIVQPADESHPNSDLDPALTASGTTTKESGKQDSAYTFMLNILATLSELDESAESSTAVSRLLHSFSIIYSWILFLHQTWQGRILFYSEKLMEDENGILRRFGITSEDAEQGDSICMFYGGRTMYVLRERPPGISSELSESVQTYRQQYRFIDDAYVYGCMNGQVFELLDRGAVSEELFDIG